MDEFTVVEQGHSFSLDLLFNFILLKYLLFNVRFMSCMCNILAM